MAKNDVAVKSEGVNSENGSYVITTEPVIFARGLISGTQLGHFAETKNPGLENVIRGRVTFRSLVSESPFHVMCVEGDLDGRSQLTFVERLDEVTKRRRLLGAQDGRLIGVGGSTCLWST